MLKWQRDYHTGAHPGFFGFFAHAGFLSALRELGIAAEGFAGSSSGAIIAGMAGSGMSDDAIKGILFGLKKSDFWDPDPLPIMLRAALRLFKGYPGYLRGEGFSRLLGAIPVKRIEQCPIPVVITATNLTSQREALFTRGSLIKAIQASGAVPMLFKPVEINGALHVDGGMVNKAPVQALADLIQPKALVVHFIASGNLQAPANGFMQKRMTPWHIHHLSVNISRREAYRRQFDIVKERGIRIIEVKTCAPGVGPNSLETGPTAYQTARKATLEILSKKGFRREHSP